MMTAESEPGQASSRQSRSAWKPLGDPLFRALWIATLVSNIGTWMHDVGAGWLMTSLSSSPVMVALVQTATTLPVFLLALPAGALADIVDRRRFLIVVQLWMGCVAALLATTVLIGVVTSWSLLVLTFAMGIGAAMMIPAWASITPEIVPKSDLQSAIALNSMGMNVARAIGPALAGVIVSYAGTGAVFALNALSYAGIIIVLMRWQRTVPLTDLPAERFFGALRQGVRFALHAPALQAAVVRGAGFFLFASASWALLPLIVRNLPDGGPQAFGILVAAIGVGAVLGALVLPALRKKLSRDAQVALASVLYALVLLGLASIDRLWPLAGVMTVAGVAWITILSSLQVAAQMALPNWVRSRGLAVFMAVFMGSMALGSLVWGGMAQVLSINQSLIIASVGALAATALTWRWKVSGIESVELTPSMHWPTPRVHDAIENDRGPVLVTIEYDVQPEKAQEFLCALRELGRNRQRDGAFFWSVFEDTERPDYFIETFSVESWLDHLRQHERVTEADKAIQEFLKTLLVEGASPIVKHYVAPRKQLSNRKGDE
jgi:MFS family permease/quinol monooxygenase YgiN